MLTVNFDFKQVVRKKLPIVTWLPKYTLTKFFRDVLAGLSVALTEIPQGIAYAAVAGLSPEYGLYSGLLGGFVYLLFGTCKDLNIGPTSILALMLQSHVSIFGPDVAILMAFISGVLIFVLGALQLGFVIDFFSYPVIAGFSSAASLQIASTQIKSLFGIPGKADKFLEAWESFFEHIDETSQWDAILGCLSILGAMALREIRVFGSIKPRPDWSKRRNIFGAVIIIISLARNAIIVAIGTIIAYCLRDQNLFKLTGPVNGGYPPIELPKFSASNNGTDYDFGEISQDLGVSIIFIPLVAILESISIAKSFSKGKSLDASQEFIALGLCNFFSSFIGSMPLTGSFTRTAINNASGVKTPVSGAISGLIMILAIAVLTDLLYYIPKATLAAVIISSMMYVFEYGAFISLWNHKKLDLLPLLATFLCGIFLSLEYGILIGIGVNLIFVLYSTARPKLNVTEEKSTKFNGKIFVFTPKDTLYFPAAEFLRDTVLETGDQSDLIVIDGKYIRNIDYTVARCFVTISQELLKQKKHIVFLNFKESVKKVCSGIDQDIDRYFKSGDLEGVEVLKELEYQDIPEIVNVAP